MLELNNVMNAVYRGLATKTEELGFKPIIPEGAARDAAPTVSESENRCHIDYVGEKDLLRLEFADDKLMLGLGEKDAGDDREFKTISTSLMILDEYDERDVRSVINELIDTLEDNFGAKQLAKKNSKLPATVSKSAVKGGSSSYDPATLAARIVMIYPELKQAYKDNVDAYGEFLPEDFFVNHANAKIFETIRANEPKAMRKLFNQLADIYDNGTNEVQNLIAVTILGSAHNDPTIMRDIMEYLSDSMVEPVVQVNKILEKSKSARDRLENPPKYKPKKKKGFAAKALGQ